MLSKQINRVTCVLQRNRLFTVSSRNFSDSQYFKVLREEALSSNVKECQYAVRGAIPMKGEEIKKRIKNGDLSFPFPQVTPLNIGNP